MTPDEDVECSLCGKPAKVEIEGKSYGPYWDDDGEEAACIYCAADETGSSFYQHDYNWSAYTDMETIREYFESGVLYMGSKKRP